jgi:drug/metabolite transporter (DMT)-like permease
MAGAATLAPVAPVIDPRAAWPRSGVNRTTGLQLAALVALAALWGASFLFIGVAVGALGPVPLMASRVTLAGAALVLCAAITGRLGAVRLTPGLLLLGALNAAIPFSLIAAAQLHLTASVAAILNATVPLFAALAAAAWQRRPVAPRCLAGLGLGLTGVALVVGWTPINPSRGWLLAAAASLLASASYGVAGVYAACRLPGTSALTLAIGQQLGAAVLLVPPALVWAPARWPPPAVAGAVLGLALLSTALGFVLYFFLVTRAGPVTAASVTFLIPLFGVLGGTLLLGDPLGRGVLVGLAAILGGVFLVRDTGGSGRVGDPAPACPQERWRAASPSA